MAPWSPLLARIDDRLVHGQVVVGCCQPMGARRILLVDDAVAEDALQQKLYRAAVPPEVAIDFVGIDASAQRLGALQSEGELEHLIVVVARAGIMGRLRLHGVQFRCVQLGGAHARPGATELTAGVFLDPEDRDALEGLLDAGTEVVIQPVSQSRAIQLDRNMLRQDPA